MAQIGDWIYIVQIPMKHSDWIAGIFSSRDRAERYAESHKHESDFGEAVVVERRIDLPDWRPPEQPSDQ